MPQVQVIPIESLVQDAENANEGTERGAQLIDYSISTFGYLESATVDADNNLVGGNKRVESAKRQGFKKAAVIELGPDEIAVIKRPDLDLDSEDESVRNRSRQAAYALNWSATQSIRLNPVMVESDLARGLDLSPLMTRKDLVRLGVQLDRPNADLEDDEYEAPAEPSAAQQTWQVKPGDIFQLGRHVLACGDCTDPALLERILPAAPALVVTSPPYGVGKEYETGGIAEWHSLMGRAFQNFADINCNVVAVNLGDRHTGNDGWEAHTYGLLVETMSSIGYHHLNTRVWVKQPAWSQSPYWRTTFKTVDEFEYIGVFALQKPVYMPRLTDDENNEWGYRSVWTINSVSRNDIHSAMFPLELPIRLIRLHTDRDDLVLEPFCGSGTTLIAAEAMRRSCVAVELLPEYCAVALQRFRDVTHLEPERVFSAD